jgi:hypothetical protein
LHDRRALAGDVHSVLVMQVFRVLCVSCVVFGAIEDARAEDPPAPPPAAAPVAAPVAAPAPEVSARHSMALGTNLPLLWKDGDTVAGSLYVSLSDRHAIRANVASYANHGAIAKDILSGIAGGESPSYHGRITDLGLAWVFYPRRVWEGFLFEAGALRRARDVGSFDGDATFAAVDKTTTVYAGRAMVGWSWRLYRYVFVAAAAGVSVGWESGDEVSRTDYDDRMIHKHISRADVTGEGYLRIGTVFDL